MRQLLIASTLALSLGCAHNSKVTGKPEVVKGEDELRKLAAFELGCNEERLDVSDLGGGSAAVQGCEKKATYQLDGAWKQLNRSDAPKP